MGGVPHWLTALFIVTAVCLQIPAGLLVGQILKDP